MLLPMLLPMLCETVRLDAIECEIGGVAKQERRHVQVRSHGQHR